jgi:hypothetical protein
MQIELLLSQYDTKDMIVDRLARYTGTDPIWLTIESLGDVAFGDVIAFPCMRGRWRISYRNAEAEMNALDLDDFQEYLLASPPPSHLPTATFVRQYLAGLRARGVQQRQINESALSLESVFQLPAQSEYTAVAKTLSAERVRLLDLSKDLDDMPLATHSPFRRTQFKWKYSVPRVGAASTLSFDQIFERLQLSESVPFVAWNGMYKLFRPRMFSLRNRAWQSDIDTGVVCKIKGKMVGEWADCVITMSDSTLDWTIDGNLKYDIARAVGLESDVAPTESPASYGGYFVVYNMLYDMNSLQYMLFSNKLFAQCVAIDERNMLSRERTNIHLFAVTLGKRAQRCHLSIMSDSLDLTRLNYDKQDANGYAVKVRMSGVAHDGIGEYSQRLIAALLSRFDSLSARIANLMKERGIDLRVPRQAKRSELTSHKVGQITLASKFPRIFPKNYSRACSSIPAEVEVDGDADPGSLLIFPREIEATAMEVDQIKLTCPNPATPHPSIINFEGVCLPCCTTTDQRTEKTLLTQWEREGTCEKESKRPRKLITTLRPLASEDATGAVPLYLRALLMGAHQATSVMRKGMPMSRASLGDAVRACAGLPAVDSPLSIDSSHSALTSAYKLNVWVWTSLDLQRPAESHLPMIRYTPALPFCHIFENWGNISQRSASRTFEPILINGSLRHSEHAAYFVEFARRAWAFDLGETPMDPVEIVSGDDASQSQLLDGYRMRRGGKMPRARTDAPVRTEPLAASELGEWRGRRDDARLIVWNAIWLYFHLGMNATKGIDAHARFDKDAVYSKSQSLPNFSLLAPYDLSLTVNGTIDTSIAQTMDRNMPTRQPSKIPDYYDSPGAYSIDSAQSLITTVFPLPDELPVESGIPPPPFSATTSRFWIKLGGAWWVARVGEFVDSPPLVIFSYASRYDIIEYRYSKLNSDDISHVTPRWLQFEYASVVHSYALDSWE